MAEAQLAQNLIMLHFPCAYGMMTGHSFNSAGAAVLAIKGGGEAGRARYARGSME
jgi:hypothetical protein